MSTPSPSPAPAPGARFSLRVRVLGYLLLVLVPVAGVLGPAWVLEMRAIEGLMGRSEWPRGAHAPDPELGFRPARNFSGTMLDGSYHVRTDTFGSRIPNHARPDAIAAQHGLLALGCSFTYGYGVEAEQAFPYVIGQSLEIPSYNFGVCAYSYATAVLLLKQLERDGTLATLSPQFLLLGAGAWLEDRSRSPFYPSDTLPFTYPYLHNQDGAAVIASAPSVIGARHALEAADSETGKGSLSRWMMLGELVPRVWFARAYRRTLPDPGSQSTLADAALYEFVVGELARIARAHEMKLAILWLPHHDVEAVNPRLVQVLAKHPDVVLIDGNEAMRLEKVPAQEFADRHPSAIAHAAYARYAAGILRPLKRQSS